MDDRHSVAGISMDVKAYRTSLVLLVPRQLHPSRFSLVRKKYHGDCGEYLDKRFDPIRGIEVPSFFKGLKLGEKANTPRLVAMMRMLMWIYMSYEF